MVNAVNPIYMIALPLAVAFSLGIFNLLGKGISRVVFLTGVVAEFILALLLVNYFYFSPSPHAINVIIGGFLPPKGINLYVTGVEALFAFIIHTIFLLGAFYWLFKGAGGVEIRGMMLYLLLSLGATGMIFTRDIFNLFVFIEITSIASYALVAFYNRFSLEAAFKFLLAGSLSSIFLLIGIILLYKHVGNLNITLINKYLIAHASGLQLPLVIAITFIFIALLIEVEMWPFNGWALDLYQGASPAIAAVLAGAVSKGFFLVFFKLNALLIMPAVWSRIVIYIGLSTFIISQFFAWRQKDFRRLLGYSSIAQLGLLVVMAGLWNISGISRDLLIVAVFFTAASHAFSKATLFWVSGLINDEERLTARVWKSFISLNPWIKGFVFIAFLSLMSVPPLPGFWGKYLLLMAMKSIPRALFYQIMAVVLIGSVAEVVYYIKWWRDLGEEKVQKFHSIKFTYAPFFSSLILVGASFLAFDYYIFSSSVKLIVFPDLYVLFILSALFIWIITYAGVTVQWVFSVLTFLVAIFLYEPVAPLTDFFFYLITVGGLIFVLGSINAARGEDNLNPFFYPLLLILTGSLVGIVGATSWLSFFVNWEIMAWSSFLLVTLSGREGKRAGWIYAVLGTFGGMALLAMIAVIYAYLPAPASFAVLFSETPAVTNPYALLLILILAIVGFGVKVAMVPFHIWARDTYAESPDAFTSFFSGIVSKIGIFGFIVFLGTFASHLERNLLLYLVAWLGTIGAFGLTLLAVFQNDAKKLLAYSSVGQVAYILVGLAIFTPLGWTAALYHTVNHALFKGLLFLAIAGVISRTGTRNLHEMGGLIKKMPISFISVLIGIIALSGVPPLSGFGGKWLLYNALLEKHWYLMLAVNMLSSVIAFLYLYRLIASIFLGQLKPKYENVKEVPVPMVISQIALWVLIIAVSTFPQLLIEPARVVIETILPARWTLTTSSTLGFVSSFGHWNAYAMMVFVVVFFIAALLALFVSSPRAVKVKQLDIGYSGEVPTDPDELHYSWGFFNHYFKGMSWILKIKVEPIYRWLWENGNGVIEVVRRFYTGNGVTYAYYITISAIVVIYIITRLG